MLRTFQLTDGFRKEKEILEIIIREDGKELAHEKDIYMFIGSCQHNDGKTTKLKYVGDEMEKIEPIDCFSSTMACLTGAYDILDSIFSDVPELAEMFEEWITSDAYKESRARCIKV